MTEVAPVGHAALAAAGFMPRPNTAPGPRDGSGAVRARRGLPARATGSPTGGDPRGHCPATSPSEHPQFSQILPA